MADVIGQRIAGNLVYIDKGAHRRRLIDAIGPDVIKFIDDFVAGVAADAQFDNFWTVTRVEGGAGESTVARTDMSGGALLLTTDAAENDGVNMQLLGESFKLAAGAQLYFGIRYKISDATQSDFFAGLAITDTDILGGVTDRIGFEKLDGATAVKGMLEKDSTETLSGTLLTQDADAFHILEFYVDENGNVDFYVDGVATAAASIANLPNDEELRVSLHFLAGEAVAKTMTIDWIRCIQIGGRA
jgi:hypothetical protein